MIPKKREAPLAGPAVLLEKWGELSPFAVGALLAVFGLLFSRTAAVRSSDIFFLFGFGFNLIVFFFASRRAFAEGHSATSNYLVYIHVQYV